MMSSAISWLFRRERGGEPRGVPRRRCVVEGEVLRRLEELHEAEAAGDDRSRCAKALQEGGAGGVRAVLDEETARVERPAEKGVGGLAGVAERGLEKDGVGDLARDESFAGNELEVGRADVGRGGGGVVVGQRRVERRLAEGLREDVEGGACPLEGADLRAGAPLGVRRLDGDAEDDGHHEEGDRGGAKNLDERKATAQRERKAG